MMWGYNAAGWFWMLPMMLVGWSVGLAIIVLVVRAVGAPRVHGDEALQALRRRLATGEISPEEYEKTKRLLQP
jgi:uncharacterized membrane protein